MDDDDEERADNVHDDNDDGLGPPRTIHMSVTCPTRDEGVMNC